MRGPQGLLLLGGKFMLYTRLVCQIGKPTYNSPLCLISNVVYPSFIPLFYFLFFSSDFPSLFVENKRQR